MSESLFRSTVGFADNKGLWFYCYQ